MDLISVKEEQEYVEEEETEEEIKARVIAKARKAKKARKAQAKAVAVAATAAATVAATAETATIETTTATVDVTQPTVCIGTLGHVANGKSSLVRAMTSKATHRFKKEVRSGRTINIGYANCKIFKCNCDSPECYRSHPESDTPSFCEICLSAPKLVSYLSFVDLPGHNLFMKVVLSGACVFDSAILVFSASSKPFPASQTMVHLGVMSAITVNSPICVLNKVDLVTKEEAKQRVSEVKVAVVGTQFEGAPIIPISANSDINLDYLCEYLAKITPSKERSGHCEMTIIGSFNTNSQGASINTLKGGVVGGSIIRGRLKPGDNVTVLPGHLSERKKALVHTPITATVISTRSGETKLPYVVAGGLVAAELSIDPCFASKDKLAGSVLIDSNVSADSGYFVLSSVTIEKFYKVGESTFSKKARQVVANCSARSTNCTVKSKRDGIVELIVAKGEVVLAKMGGLISLSRNVNDIVNVIGFGYVCGGQCIRRLPISEA